MTKIDLGDDLLAGLDRFIADRDRPPRGRMERNEAIAVIVRDWLMAQGFLDIPGETDEITPALEAADVPKA